MPEVNVGEPEQDDIDLQVLLESVLDGLAVRAQAKGLGLSRLVASGTPRRVRGDRGRLLQVLRHLADNAIEFTPAGEVSVHVETVQVDASRVELCFGVRDTGLGLEPEAQQRLFQPSGRSAGDGLATCRQLVERMGGRIDCTSAPGQGCEFIFTAVFAPCPLPPPEGVSRELAGQRVLCVDASAAQRAMLERDLAGLGLRPTCVTSAEEALRALTGSLEWDDPFAALLLDQGLPDADVRALASRLRARPRFAGLPLVLLAPIQDGEDRRPPEGFAATLTKPVHLAHLRERLSALLSKRGGGRAPEPRAPLPVRPAQQPNGRILVVEDNPVNQRVVAMVLEKLGFRPDLAGNGLEALAALERARYDLILMDCQMPQMDGYQATAEIRRREAGLQLHVPIVALTAHALHGDRERCLAAGMDGFLTKPVRVEELREALASYLPARSAER